MPEMFYPPELTQAQVAWFQKLLDRHRLRHFEPLLAPRLEPCIGLDSLGPDDYSHPGSSRLGGVPDWPEDWAWPMSSNETLAGRVTFPMAFICQLNLAELAHLASPLPKQGLLYIFWDTYDEPLSCAVLHYQGDLDSLRQPGAGRPQSLAEIVMGLAFDETPASRPQRLGFHSALSLPCSGEFDRCFGEAIDLDDESFDAYLELGEELMGDWLHYLFGYHFSHSSLRDLGEDDGEPRATTLMCFYSDEDLGIDFSELGPLHMLIEKSALVAGDFSRVQLAREAG